MHLDWQRIEHLLLINLLEQESQIAVLHRILPLFQQQFPQVNLTVLAESTVKSAEEFQNSFPNEQRSTLGLLSLPFLFTDWIKHPEYLVSTLKLRSFDAAIILTLSHQSPYLIAYCCYLAGIPIRVGQSCEFGGGVLSHWVKPPLDPVNSLAYQLHLLRSIGLAIDEPVQSISST